MSEIDLTPRPAPTARRRRRWPGLVVLGLVAVAVVVVFSSALGDATLFFYNADEAVERRDELGDERIRLQGTVVPDTTTEVGDTVEFDIEFNGVAVPVIHEGDPPELFDAGIPLVLEGQWSAATDDAIFRSDRMLVKHDESYEAEHTDRIDEAEAGSGVAP
jgi:cytochrome c-type biogenesis protein CcmE